MAKINRYSVFLIAFILSTVVLVFLSESKSIGYYSENDLLGPMSEYSPLIFLALIFISFVAIAILWKVPSNSPSTKLILLTLVPVLLLFALKYILPDVTEVFYASNFPDAPSHLLKGLFVTTTGHSDALLNGYFDLQPGFFWTTGIVLNVCSSDYVSICNGISLFILKWFHLIAICAYVPLLFIFYKKMLKTVSLVGLALLLQFSLDISHFHYTAEVCGIFIYWLIILLILLCASGENRKYLMLSIIMAISLIFLHQGLTIFTILAFSAMIIYPYIFRIIGSKSKKSIYSLSRRLIPLLLILLLVWFIYLSFITIFTFQNFVETLKNVINSLLEQNSGLISSGLYRANPNWGQLVFYKAIFIAGITLMGLLCSLANALRTKSEVDKAVFTIQLFVAGFIFVVSVALGGAGYVERVMILLPIVVYSLVEFVTGTQLLKKSLLNNKKRKIIISTISIVFVSILLIAGTAFYFSARNIQAVSYSELAQNTFIVIHDPNNIAGLYTQMNVKSIAHILTNGLQPDVIYLMTMRSTRLTSLTITGDDQIINTLYENVTKSNNQIYDNGQIQMVFG